MALTRRKAFGACPAPGGFDFFDFFFFLILCEAQGSNSAKIGPRFKTARFGGRAMPKIEKSALLLHRFEARKSSGDVLPPSSCPFLPSSPSHSYSARPLHPRQATTLAGLSKALLFNQETRFETRYPHDRTVDRASLQNGPPQKPHSRPDTTRCQYVSIVGS